MLNLGLNRDLKSALESLSAKTVPSRCALVAIQMQLAQQKNLKLIMSALRINLRHIIRKHSKWELENTASLQTMDAINLLKSY